MAFSPEPGCGHDPLRERASLAVRLYWLDFGGNRVFYQTIPPGQAVYQPAYESHRWIVTTEADECLALYEPSGIRSIAEIR